MVTLSTPWHALPGIALAGLPQPGRDGQAVTTTWGSTDLALYRQLFVARHDAYALQQESGRYARVRAPVDDELLRAHLSGEITCAWHCFDAEGMLRWACVDADGSDGLLRLQQVYAELRRAGLTAWLEASHGGRGHLWLFLAPQPASPVRRLLAAIVGPVAEIFPKSDVRGRGVGPVVRGPLGVHRRWGQRFGFVEPLALTPYPPAPEEPLAPLTGAVAYSREAIEAAAAAWRPLRPWISLPRSRLPQAGDVAERLVPLVQRDGYLLGVCPNHPATGSSLLIYPEQDRWYCLQEGVGGDGVGLHAHVQRLSGRQAASALMGGVSPAAPPNHRETGISAPSACFPPPGSPGVE